MFAAEKLWTIYDAVRPFLDMAILAFILYKAYEIIISTNSIQILRGALIIVVAYLTAIIFHLETLLWILGSLAPGFLVVFAVVFQPEIRKIFLRLGQKEWFSLGTRSKHSYVDSVLMAAEILSKQKRGMLAVFVRHTKLDDIVKTGTRINADLSSSLLVTIFGHDTPLHDGAVIIQGGKILSAGCFLPLSEQYDIKKTFGTRHRASLGLAETTDAVVLVVSEETGAISLSYDSRLHYNLSMRELSETLVYLLGITSEQYTIEDTVDENKAAFGKAE
ncbi:MAG: TIGR00159 family protein [Treponema sp.]|nr:TIGR00159 family protein [Treponema sp.]MBD5435052.1 TIGR00159 family protein [Treponema sp.]MBD5438231.1 TIGR00159 family protein [Treponema sp.]